VWDDDTDKRERLANTVNNLLGDVSVRRKLLRLLYLCIGINVLIWVSALLFPADLRDAFDRVHAVSDRLSKIVLVVPFVLGMSISYFAFRLRFPDIEEQNLEADVMASYAYHSHSQKRWLVWLFSVIGGVANLLLLVGTTLFLSSEGN